MWGPGGDPGGSSSHTIVAMTDKCEDAEIKTEAAFRGAQAAVSVGVLGMAAVAIRARGVRALWRDRGSAYMQLLCITSAISLLQFIHAVIDISWLAAMRGDGTSADSGQSLGECEATTSNSSYGCWVRRVDASMNITCLSLVLVAFLVITFFFLRMAIRFRISNPDQMLLQEAQQALKAPLVVSVGWVCIVWLSALSGLQPHAFTCKDPIWVALLLSFVLVGIALVTGVVIILYERQKRRRGNKFWNSLLSLAAVLVLATVLAVLELLDHVLRHADCWPRDEVVGACMSDLSAESPVVRGVLHLTGRTLIYVLPSIALLSLFRSHRRPRTCRNSEEAGMPEASNTFSPSGLAQLSPLPSLLRPFRPGGADPSSMTEALLRAPPSVSSHAPSDPLAAPS